MDAESRVDAVLYIDFVVLIVDKLVAEAAKPKMVYATLHIHSIACSHFIVFLLLHFLSALTPFPDKLSAVPVHHSYCTSPPA
jgi:hypothetical protein